MSFNIVKDKQLSEFFGKMLFTENSGVWTFTKQLGKPSEHKNENDKTIMKSMFSAIEWQYTITLLDEIIKVDSEHGQADINGNTIHWTVGLTEFAGDASALSIQLKNK